MNRILLAGIVALAAGSSQAFAADLPPPMAPPPRAPAAYVPIASPAFNWSGFYLGGNLGVGFNHGSISDTFGLYNWGVNNNATFAGGGQVGANYQFNSVVVGVEGDFDWFANNNNSGGGTPVGLGAAGTTISGSNNGRWLTTLTGRLGYAFDRVLVYGKGGGAWVGSNNLTLLNVPTGATVSFGNPNTNFGWVAGAGVEWAFYNNWTAKLEYDYIGLSSYSFTVPGTFPVAAVAGDTFVTSSRNVQMVTLGVNYLFNGF
jgi:outer membrane immunogenic protein